MIKIFKWVIEYQDDTKDIVKNYISYIQICMIKIKNFSTKTDAVETTRKFLENDLTRVIWNWTFLEDEEKNIKDTSGNSNNFGKNKYKKFIVYFHCEFGEKSKYVFPIESDSFNIEKQYI